MCVSFPYSFANRSDFWFSANIIDEKWHFGVVGWVFIVVLGGFLASNKAFILFIVVLIYVYFMSEIEHILAAVHTDTCFTMNDCSLPIFLLSVYICVTYSTLLYLYIKDGSPLWYEWWIIFPACQLSFGSAGSGVDVQTCIFVSEISSHFSYSVRVSCHWKKDFPWAEYKKFSYVFHLVLLWLTFLILKTNTFGIYPGEWYEGCIQLYFLTKN